MFPDEVTELHAHGEIATKRVQIDKTSTGNFSCCNQMLQPISSCSIDHSARIDSPNFRAQ